MQLEPGDPIDTDSFSTEANRCAVSEIFEKVGYQLVEEGDRLGVEFSGDLETLGPGYLRGGLPWKTISRGEKRLDLAGRCWRAGLDASGLGSAHRGAGGAEQAFATEFYQPLRGDSRLFVPHRASRVATAQLAKHLCPTSGWQSTG